jgi:hypothetical protein
MKCLKVRKRSDGGSYGGLYRARERVTAQFYLNIKQAHLKRNSVLIGLLCQRVANGALVHCGKAVANTTLDAD